MLTGTQTKSLSVAQRLAALAEGKKIRQKSWDEGAYIHLVDEGIGNDEGSKPFKLLHLGDDGSGWELYTEPTVLECWVVFNSAGANSKWCHSPDLKIGDEYGDGLVVHIEHVRVELPSSAAVPLDEPATEKFPKTLDGVINLINNRDWAGIVKEIDEEIGKYEEPTQTREFWVNIYPTFVALHGTEFNANRHAECDRIACKKIVVSFKEGDTE